MRNDWQLDPVYFAPVAKFGGGWICLKDSPAPPPAPDYVGAATAQGAANKEAATATAMLGNPNINSPYGAQRVTYAPGPDGNWIPTVDQTLSPSSQSQLDTRNQTQSMLGNLAQTGAGIAQGQLGNGFSFGGGPTTNLGDPGQVSGAPNLFSFGQASGPDTGGIAAMPVNGGMTAQNAILSRLEPAMARSRASLDNRLANQGIMRGSEAYDTDQTLQGQAENDARTQAALQGIGIDMSANAQGFGQAMNRSAAGNAAIAQNQGVSLQQQQAGNAAVMQRFNQALQSGQFGNTATQQALAQALALRSQPLNEINALMSSSQINNPQFAGYQGSQVLPANTAGATQQAGQYAKDMYGFDVGNTNEMNSGMFKLAAAAIPLMISDRRLKSNIVRVGTHPLGIGIYEYDIFGMRDRGVMADEVRTVKPDAVVRHRSGYMMVDYGRL